MGSQRAAPLGMDLVEMREVGCDTVEVPAFPVLFVGSDVNVQLNVLPRELGCEEDVKLAEDRDIEWRMTLANDALVINISFRGGSSV